MRREEHNDGGSFNRTQHQPSSSYSRMRRHRDDRLILWRLLGAFDELTCVVRETRYGHTLSLELAGEQIVLELQPTVEALVERASRLEAWLLSQGWTSAETVID